MVFCMPSPSVIPFAVLPYWGPKASVRAAKRAGFNAVEFHLFGDVWRNPDNYAALAEKEGLYPRFHEGWSPKESSTPSIVWSFLSRTGFLYGEGLAFDQKVPQCSYPMVLYANEIAAGRPSNHCYQTMSVLNDYGGFRLGYLPFKELWLQHGGKIVFDTYHFLEWAMSGRGEMFHTPPKELMRRLVKGFEFFAPHVVELHLANCSRDGRRNVALLCEEGVIPLREFCRFVAKSGWRGVVTPEVDFRFLVSSVERGAGGLVCTTRSAKLLKLLEETKMLMLG